MGIELRWTIFAASLLTLAAAGCSHDATSSVKAASQSGAPERKAAQKQEKKPMSQEWAGMVDEDKAKKATAVLRVRYRAMKGGNKYAWDEVDVLAVIENRSQYQFPKTLNIAHYDTEPGIPKGECTVYLEPYNNVDLSLWKLLDGSGAHGVSHAVGER